MEKSFRLGDRVRIRPRPEAPGKRPVKVVFPEQQPPGKPLQFLGDGWTTVKYTPYISGLRRRGDIEIEAAAPAESAKPAPAKSPKAAKPEGGE